MRIAINATSISVTRTFRNTGVSRYIRCLVESLADVDPDNEYCVFVSRDVDAFVEQDNVRFMSARPNSGDPRGRIWWEQVGLPGMVRALDIDVLHSPMNVMPLAYGGPSVVTVHDLSFLLCPGTRSWRKNVYVTWGTRRSVRRCDAVITSSEAVRSDVLAHYRMPGAKVTAIPLAPVVTARARPGPDAGLPFGGDAIRQYAPPVLDRLYRDNHVHNLYLQIWLESGIFVLIAFLAGPVVFYARAFRCVHEARTLVAGALGVVTAFGLHGLFDVPLVHGLQLLAGFALAVPFVVEREARLGGEAGSRPVRRVSDGGGGQPPVPSTLYTDEYFRTACEDYEEFNVLTPDGRVIIHTVPNVWYDRYAYPAVRLVRTVMGQGDRYPGNPRQFLESGIGVSSTCGSGPHGQAMPRRLRVAPTSPRAG
jgi:hypothetical protein